MCALFYDWPSHALVLMVVVEYLKNKLKSGGLFRISDKNE